MGVQDHLPCTATENKNLHDGMANTLTGNKGLRVGIGAILGKTIENKIILMYMYAKRIKLLPPECFLQGQTSSLHTWIHFQYLLGLKQVTAGHNVIVWSKISLIKEEGKGEGVHSGLNGLNFEKFFTDLEGWPLLVSLVDQRPVIMKSNIVSKFPWYEIIIVIISVNYHC